MRHRLTSTTRKIAARARLAADLLLVEIRHLHWPQWDPWIAAGAVGAGAGLLMAALGALATLAVSMVRGVAGGAGAAGLVVVVLLASAVVVLAAYCLRQLGSTRGGAVAVLGALVVIVLVLALFLRPAATAWAFVILPALGTLAFIAADRVLISADHDGKQA